MSHHRSNSFNLSANSSSRPSSSSYYPRDNYTPRRSSGSTGMPHLYTTPRPALYPPTSISSSARPMGTHASYLTSTSSSSRYRYPPTSSSKFFDIQGGAGFYDERLPPSRSQSLSGSTPPPAGFHSTRFNPIPREDRRESHSSSKKATMAWSRRESDSATGSHRHASLSYNASEDQYRYVKEAFVKEDQLPRERRHKSHHHYVGSSASRDPARSDFEDYCRETEPAHDEGRHYERRPSHRKSSRGGDGDRQRQGDVDEIPSELENLQLSKTLRDAEKSWDTKSWYTAWVTYGTLQQKLERAALLEQKLGRPDYKDFDKQAQDARHMKKRALEKLNMQVDQCERDYERHMNAVDHFTDGASRDVAKAAQSYNDAITALESLGRLSPGRLKSRFPNRVADLRRLRSKLMMADRAEEDDEIADAVRAFANEFYLVEMLIAKGDGAESRRKFDKAKKMLRETVAALPKRRLPSDEWMGNMAWAIKDQETRAKGKFGDCW